MISWHSIKISTQHEPEYRSVVVVAVTAPGAADRYCKRYDSLPWTRRFVDRRSGRSQHHADRKGKKHKAKARSARFRNGFPADGVGNRFNGSLRFPVCRSHTLITVLHAQSHSLAATPPLQL
jgi:hypothetical protein